MSAGRKGSARKAMRATSPQTRPRTHDAGAVDKGNPRHEDWSSGIPLLEARQQGPRGVGTPHHQRDSAYPWPYWQRRRNPVA